MKKAIFIFTILILCSCMNYTKGIYNICPKHGVRMNKSIKRMQYGFVTNDGNTIEIPFGSNLEGGGCEMGPPYCIGYVCPACRKLWNQQRNTKK